MRIFLLMVQFFTRIPVPIELEVKQDDFAKGVKLFPLIGLMIGALNLGVYTILTWLVDRSIALGLVWLFQVLITGAFHLDGLADTCDGLFSSRTKEKMLEIMRDSRIGTNGALAIIFDVVIKLLILWKLPTVWLTLTLLLTPMFSRTAQVVMILTSKPAREGNGLGNLFLGKVKWREAGWSVALAALVIVICWGYRGFAILMLNGVGIYLYWQLTVKKIGGMTGDTLGATNEWSEFLTLLALAIFSHLA